ncbi:MAG: hypothetical protein BVN34_03240 [Proteobacteria bacterium ST_bin12]|nr:MAG: hypothetical protein BVN34_03240 [Proteobacteria bacterium ST_bin12]
MLQNNQKGFTLLELLVVITLLATLSVGALVAYEGIGENATSVAAANNIKVADSSIRTFRAIENVYPNQWDNLANVDGLSVGGAQDVLADATLGFFGQWTATTANNVTSAVASSLNAVGVNEFQTLRGAATINLAQVSPNEAFNESAPGVSVPADELEFEFGPTGALSVVNYANATQATWSISVVPSGGNNQACTAGGGAFNAPFQGAALTDNSPLNRINDNLDNDECNLVIAVGFGKDVPGTTLDSRVAISTAPTYTNGITVNPSTHYARFMALFHVASDEDGNGTIATGEVFPRARLLAVVDTEGRTIDESIAGAFRTN